MAASCAVIRVPGGGCLPCVQPRPPGQRRQARRARPAAQARPAWRRCASWPLSCRPLSWRPIRGGRIKVAVVWQYVFAGDRASYAATVRRRLEHQPDAFTARTRHRPRPAPMRAARPRRCPRPGADGMRYRVPAPYGPSVPAAAAPCQPDRNPLADPVNESQPIRQTITQRANSSVATSSDRVIHG